MVLYTISLIVPYYIMCLTFPTVQERLTKQIAEAISEALEPAGVAVVIEARCDICLLISLLTYDILWLQKPKQNKHTRQNQLSWTHSW